MASGANFRLIVRRGPQPNQIYELTKDVMTLGRDITNDIVVSDPEVSRHHTRLSRTASGYAVEDLGSTNGTFVNGQRVTGGPLALSNGDLVGVGETVTFAYEATGAASQAQPTMVSAGAPPAPAPSPPPARPAAAVRPAPLMAQEEDIEGQPNRTLIIGIAAAVVICCCIVGVVALLSDIWCPIPIANQIAVLCPVP